MSLEETIEKLVDAKIAKASQGPQTVLAEYKGLDSQGKGWVVISGSTEATPISRAVVEANPGDTVSVTIGDGRAVMDANISNPSAGVVGVKKVAQTAEQAKGDAEKAISYSTQASMAANSAQASAEGAALAAADAQTTADVVHGIAEQAQIDAGTAKTAAESAQNSLKSVVQGATTVEKAVSVMQTALEAVIDYDPQEDTVTEYFWHDANGAHVLGDESGYRNDIDSSGMTIVELSSEEDVAHFGASGTLIGKASSGNYIEMDSDSIDMYHESSALVHFGYGEGNAEDGTDYAPYYTLGSRKIADIDYSAGPYEVGDQVRYEGIEYVCTEKITQPEAFNPDHWHLLNGCNSVAVGEEVTADGWASNAEGNWTHANGSLSHAEGQNTYSSGFASHAENGSSGGVPTMATGTDSHAEGGGTVASGLRAHAQGYRSVASGNNSHAEGSSTVASATGAHSQGQGTIAASTNQTAIGKHNVADANNTYAVIVGNGTADNARSDALRVDWSGNVGIAGDVQDLSGNQLYADATHTHAASDITGIAFRSGIETITPVSQGIASKSVSFDTDMPGKPVVTVTLGTAVSAQLSNWHLSVTSTSASGFTLNVYNAGTNTTARNVCWMAIYQA